MATPNEPAADEGRNVDDGAGARVGALSAQGASRRALLRGGAAAAPLVLTVVSNPVMATSGACTNVSSFASVNMSRPDVMSSCANGKKPSWWLRPQNGRHWPDEYPKSTLFNAALGASGPCDASHTLEQVLAYSDTTGNRGVAKHMAAALLNSAKGYVPGNIMTTTSVRALWVQFVAGPYRFSPTPGVTWYADSSSPAGPGGMTAWLQSTMPVA